MIKGPIVIGGIGGSGTRVVVSILKSLKIYIGEDLNVPLDNLTYTLLFKRTNWFSKNRTNKKKINIGLSILEKSMINKKHYSLKELMFIFNAATSMARNGHNKQKKGKGWWAFERFNHIIFNRNKGLSSYVGWGWKEPNSHLLVSELNDYFSQIKYVHTIRHGLDMAYSNNQQQLYNWSKLFGLSEPQNEDDITFASFRYWVEANRKIIDLKNSLGGNKIYILNFDKLCHNPKKEIDKLLDFVGIEVNEKQLLKVISIPKTPSTKSRYKKHDISKFNKDDIKFLIDIGFKV